MKAINDSSSDFVPNLWATETFVPFDNQPEGFGRIINGVPATPGEYPWSVIVSKKGGVHCGGILLNARTALTAAHCVPSKKFVIYFVGKAKYNIFKDRLERMVLGAVSM